MTENQKLREALQLIAWSNDSKWQADCARQALAMPTADHIPDAGEMVADQAPNAGKMIETAAPVGERLTLSAEDVHAAFVKHFPKTRISQAWIGFAAEIAEAIAARAALSAGDAVDAQRYRWLVAAERSYLIGSIKRDIEDALLPAGKTFESLDAAIDYAIRARKDNT